MRDLAILVIQLIMVLVRFFHPGDGRSIVTELLLVKHPLLVLNRSRERALNLRPMDQIIAGLCAGLRRGRLGRRAACILQVPVHSRIMGVVFALTTLVSTCYIAIAFMMASCSEFASQGLFRIATQLADCAP